MPALTQLNAAYSESPVEGAERLTFACPNCRKRLIIIDVWESAYTDAWTKDSSRRLRVHQRDHRDLASITIQPSIDDKHGKSYNGCEGWHGHIKYGVAT